MIRRLRLEDQPAVRIKAETLAAERYPEMVPDVDREIWLMRNCAYAKVIGEIGKPVAALIARKADNLWATKQNASILLWYSEKTGAGVALMRDFMKWVREENVLVAGLVDDMSYRTYRLLSRLGFESRGGAFLYFPRGSKR